MSKPLDLTGQRFGKLTVIKRVENNKHGSSRWLCRCDCGNTVFVVGHQLKRGKPKSCGCLKIEVLSQIRDKYHPATKAKLSNTKHNKCYTRLYKVYCGMKGRCTYPSHKSYKNYGGRGIKVCKEWDESFENFYIWAMEHGYDENAPHGQCTIDRIDVDGNYEPSNCRWVNLKTQAQNKRNNKK